MSDTGPTSHPSLVEMLELSDIVLVLIVVPVVPVLLVLAMLPVLAVLLVLATVVMPVLEELGADDVVDATVVELLVGPVVSADVVLWWVDAVLAVAVEPVLDGGAT